VRRIAGVSGVMILLLAASAAAQEPTRNEPSLLQRLEAPPPPSLEAAPRVLAQSNERTGQSEKTKLALPAAPGGQSVALMIAGGALFVAGAIVGGDAGTLLMVGGAGIGAYGIYLYFR
jgi:hypothetical protein